MSKSIIVIETPKNCGECGLHASWQSCAFSHREYWCPVSGSKDVDPHRKPNWCPLKPLPEKKLARHNDSSDDYQRGYNQCLSEITGQVKEEEAYDE